MIRLIAKPALIGAASLVSLFAAATASAEYRVTAFAETDAYFKLIAQDAEAAMSVFEGRAPSVLDFAEANNLCVAEILAKDFTAAISTCEIALEKLEGNRKLGFTKSKSARATIYSNMAVAKALAGDLVAAAGDVEKALQANSEDLNVIANAQILAATGVSAELAGNL